MQRDHAGTGLALALASAATFAMSGPLATSLIASGWSPGAAVTARIVIAALVLTVPAVFQLRGHWGDLRASAGRVVLFGVFAVAVAQLAFFNALEHLPVGVALLMEYLGTVLIVGWLWVVHGQRPRRLTVAGAVTAILGLVLVLDLTGTHRLDLVGVAWGLLAATGLATYFLVSASSTDRIGALPMAWAGMVVGGIGLLVFAAVGVLPMRATTADVHLLGRELSWVVPVVGLSVVAAAFAYLAGIGAAQLLGAKLSSFVGLTEVMFAVLYAWLALGQVPAPVQAVGGMLIAGGIVLVRWDELREPAARADAVGGRLEPALAE